MTPRVSVGIDLGTTHTVVAHLTAEGDTAVLPNSEGEVLTPSVVVFEADRVLVGNEARAVGSASLSRTAECVKRDMGLPYFHRTIGAHRLPPETIQGFILRKCHRDICQQLGEDCDVVITVPAYFDEARRHATMDAGHMSGLRVIDIVNEPTAAALAFGQKLGYLTRSGKAREPLNVLVYDLGGGTFDATVIRLEGSEFRTLATDGDVRLGGYDWDLRLVEHAMRAFEEKLEQPYPAGDAAEFDLRRLMEQLKHQLSTDPTASAQVRCSGQSFEVKVTRREFEELTADLLDRTAFTTRQTLKAAGLIWSDVDRILLVGGSTRMPMVRNMLAELSGISPDNTVHPDEAVARGAAISSYLKTRERGDAGPLCDLRVTDVASHSLGIEGIDENTLRKENVVLIPKNHSLPVTIQREFVTKQDDQPNVLVRLLEGESTQPEHCAELGRARINNLPPGLPKGTKVQVYYRFDAGGRLTVEAAIPGVGREAKMEMQRARAMPGAKVDAWKSVICQDGGYSQFETIDNLLGSALAEYGDSEEADRAGESQEVHASSRVSLEPAVRSGAPLAASETLKQTIRPAQERSSPTGTVTTSTRRPQRARIRRLVNVLGFVGFSLAGTILGLYLSNNLEVVLTKLRLLKMLNLE